MSGATEHIFCWYAEAGTSFLAFHLLPQVVTDMDRGDRIIACCSNLLLSVSIGFLLFSVVSSQIPLGSKLTVEEYNYWFSSNKDYAIGFLNFSDQYSFGVRFNAIYIPSSEQTAIWTAGWNVKVSSKAYFELSLTGEMILVSLVIGGVITFLIMLGILITRNID